MTSSTRVGRPAKVSREAIVDAALEVGFPDLSLAAVARRLGVSPAALHYHVGDRDGLAFITAEAAVASVSWPEPSPRWPDYLRACGWTVWRILAGHPGLVTVLVNLAQTAPPLPLMYERFEAAVLHLRTLGFTTGDALLAVDTVLDLAFDSYPRAAAIDRLRTAPPRTPAEAAVADLRAAASPLVRDGEVAATLARVLSDDVDTWFGRKLDVVVAGVSALASCPRPDADPAGGQTARRRHTDLPPHLSPSPGDTSREPPVNPRHPPTTPHPEGTEHVHDRHH